MLFKHSTHFELPHDAEPRTFTHHLPTSRLSLSPAPRGRRVKIRDFKLFDKLPLELKRMIWEECAMIPRYIQFDVYGRTGWNLPGWCLHDWQLFVRGGGSKCRFLTIFLLAASLRAEHRPATLPSSSPLSETDFTTI